MGLSLNRHIVIYAHCLESTLNAMNICEARKRNAQNTRVGKVILTLLPQHEDT